MATVPDSAGMTTKQKVLLSFTLGNFHLILGRLREVIGAWRISEMLITSSLTVADPLPSISITQKKPNDAI